VRSWQLHEIETPEGTRSPVVLDSEESRAVLIGMKPGQELGEHQVRERAWIVVVDGQIEVESAGDALEAPAGSLLMFDPAERHTVRSPGGARVLLLLTPWPGPGHYPPD
jgi:quercetin dioxygenase-like cupin family protein